MDMAYIFKLSTLIFVILMVTSSLLTADGFASAVMEKFAN